MAKKKQTQNFYLSEKEESAMKSLWSTEQALSAAEIAEGIPNRTWPAGSIQSILHKLEEKGAIKVQTVTKIGKSYGRLFRPTVSANEYAVGQFCRYYQAEDEAFADTMSAMLENLPLEKEEIAAALNTLLETYQK